MKQKLSDFLKFEAIFLSIHEELKQEILKKL